MQNYILKFKIILFLFLFSFAWHNMAKAQENSPKLSVSPHTFEFSVEPGQSLQDKIRILNQSSMPISILAKTSDFSAEQRTGEMRFDDQSEDSSFTAKKWLKIKKPNFILDSGEMEIVDFSIEVPKNAEPGGHYAMIMFEPQLPSNYFQEGEPKVVPVIGVIFLFSVEAGGELPSFEPLTVAEFGISDNYRLKKLENSITSFAGFFTKAQAEEGSAFSIVENAFLPFSLSIKNNNIYHTKPYGELAIIGNRGEVLGKTEINKTTILPGKIREIPVNFKPESFLFLKKYLPVTFYNLLNRNLIWGKYRAQLTLDVQKPKGIIFSSIESADDRIVRTIEFWVFPWKTVLAFVFTILLLYFAKKRLILAGKVLIRKRKG